VSTKTRKAAPGSSEWLKSHGIDPDVWEARGVLRYERGDPSVKELFRDFLPKSSLGTVTKIVNQYGGLLLPKHAPDGFPPIPPQLRPDKPVIVDGRTKWHFHGSLEGDWPVFPPEAGKAAGKGLPRKFVLPEERADGHIRRAHDGVNVEVVHMHEPEEAKYVLLGDGANKRIDLHPLSAALLPEADRVFFVLEGALKNDAVLSAGEAVFSVPSVTLWDLSELRRFVPLLRGKTIIVVPDSDWEANPLVGQQALFVRTALRHFALDAYIAAPPVEFYEAEGEKGVDDWLGRGGTLEGLVLHGREVPEAVTQWIAWFTELRNMRLQYALEGLSLHADDAGRHLRSLGALARIMGMQKRDVPRALEDLNEAVVVHGSTETEVKIWNGVKIMEWKERPIMEVREEFRATETARRVLDDNYWAKAAHDLAYQTARRVDELEQRERAREQREADDVIVGFEDLLSY
jgi:hypothetical protein